MSINSNVWTKTGNLSGTIDGNTIPAKQSGVGFPSGAIGNVANGGALWTLPNNVTEAVATLQTSKWLDLQSEPVAVLEIIQTALYMGSLSVEQTNDGTNIYTVYQDNNPTIGQTLTVDLLLNPTYRFVRVKATPTVSNVGTLAFQVKTGGQDAQNLIQGGSLFGVMNTSPGGFTLLSLMARTTTINTTYDFKIPAGCVGFDVWVHQTALTGTSATYTIQRKDPVSGTYSSVAAYGSLATAAIAAAGEGNLAVGAGITATANVSISANPGTHWGLVTTGTNTSVTSSVSIQYTM